MLARSERAELSVDERYELAHQVVGIGTDRGRVDVLVAPERGEAIGKDQDGRRHLALMDLARRPLGNVFTEALPGHMGQPGTGEAHQVEQHGKALAPSAPERLVIL